MTKPYIDPTTGEWVGERETRGADGEITQTTTAAPRTEAPAEHPAIDELRRTLGVIELDVMTSYTLADAIRQGSCVTSQKIGGWIEGDSSCAIGAAYLAARARGYVTPAER